MHNPCGAALRALAVATPDNQLMQADAIAFAEEIFGSRYEEFERLKSVFGNSGIVSRQLAQPLEWYREQRDWSERTAVFIEVATALFVKAARSALDRCAYKAAEIDAVITVSSTGVATPTLDARAAGSLNFRADIMRIPIFGLGCGGGVAGLSLAARLARAEPGMKVLLVVVELCSTAFRADKLTKSNVVATALFGDGAAAAVLTGGAQDGDVCIDAGCEHTWPDTLDIMGWKVDPIGFEVVFDRAIPPFARRHLKPAVDTFMQRFGILAGEVARLSFHPGGTKVLQAIESAFRLQPGALDIERQVLREFGNMSAPTALFVLERALNQGLRGISLLTALGPGFTASSVPIRVPQ